MSSEQPSSEHLEPAGLPPVEPPSGRFLAQLFLVPLIIVAVLVLLAVAGMWWAHGRYGSDADHLTAHFVQELSSNNPDIWWRAAHELAQVLQRQESLMLACSPRFSLDLAEKLHQEWQALRQEEQATGQAVQREPPPLQAAAFRRLAPRRDQVLFLIAALGDFAIPSGAPVLCQIAQEADGPDLKAVTLRRRRAVWALANLGQNRKRWAELSAEQESRLRQDLSAEAVRPGLRGQWARQVADWLAQGGSLGVDQTLARCAQAEDTYLRSLVALALNFWDGPQVDAVLQQLAQDDGHGTRLEIPDSDE